MLVRVRVNVHMHVRMYVRMYVRSVRVHTDRCACARACVMASDLVENPAIYTCSRMGVRSVKQK